MSGTEVLSWDSVNKALAFAKRWHGAQEYRPGVPYSEHLVDVVTELYLKGIRNDDTLAAAVLHDVLEDTDCKYSSIKSIFGLDTADLVYDVTSELGRNREERLRKTYAKFCKNPHAILIKLADRVCNIRNALKNDDTTILAMYNSEWPLFNELFKPHCEYGAAWQLLGEIQALLHPSCICDAPGDSVCQVHKRENALQDQVIYAENALRDLLQRFDTVIGRLGWNGLGGYDNALHTDVYDVLTGYVDTIRDRNTGGK